MDLERYNHPIRFYLASTLIPWGFWFIAAWISWQSGAGAAGTLAMTVLGTAGLAAPMAVAAWYMLRDPALRRDLLGRLVRMPRGRWVYLALTVLLMPASILAGMGLSLLIGRSPDQFRLVTDMSFQAGLYPTWFILVLAPLLEELAWHTYGTDCLRRRHNLFVTSMIFGVVWVLWHLPLSFIQGYYQNELVESGWIYTANYIVSLPVFVLLSNWLYMKTGRNILVAIVVHIAANLSNEVFATHPDSKVIQTGLLLVFTVFVMVKDRRLFFDKAL
jgi:membrane protease YdiL (CAAX protease family)